MKKFQYYTIMKFLGNDVNTTAYKDIDVLCEHVRLTNPEVDVNSLRNKIVAYEESLFDTERKLRIALNDYVCTINCTNWNHEVKGEYSNIIYSVSKKAEENYPLIVVYKDRIHLLNKSGGISGIINGKYRLFDENTLKQK